MKRRGGNKEEKRVGKSIKQQLKRENRKEEDGGRKKKEYNRKEKGVEKRRVQGRGGKSIKCWNQGKRSDKKEGGKVNRG